jgi:hypothetical protein
VTNREIAEQIMANPCVWNPIDGDNPYGSVDLDWIRDAITAALDAARPPAGHIMEHDGTVRKDERPICGTTADGVEVRMGDTVWHRHYHRDKKPQPWYASPGGCAVCPPPFAGWSSLLDVSFYSTREAAEAAQRAAGGGA